MGNCLDYNNLTYDNIYHLYPNLAKCNTRLQDMNVVLKDNKIYESAEYLQIRGDRQYKFMITLMYSPESDMIVLEHSILFTFEKGLYISKESNYPDMLKSIYIDTGLRKYVDVLDQLYKYGFKNLLEIYSAMHPDNINLKNYLQSKK